MKKNGIATPVRSLKYRANKKSVDHISHPIRLKILMMLA